MRHYISTFFIVSCGCHSKPSVVARDSPNLLTQDTGKLRNTNGKIVSQILLKKDFSSENETDCFKIEYLSDGLRVVGFVVKPKKIEFKWPVILFNRGGDSILA